MSTHTTSFVSEAFETALTGFKSRLTDKELKDFQGTKVEDIKYEIQRIQDGHENLKQNMNMNRIKSFLEAMEQFGKILDVFLNASQFVAFVWGPLKFMLMASHNFVEDFEILLDAYERIGEHMPFLRQYEHLFEHHAMQKMLCLLYTDIIEFHFKAFRYFTGKVWRRVFRSMWRDFNTRFEQILENLTRHKNLVAEQAHLLSMELSQRNSGKIHELFRQYMIDRDQRLRDADHMEDLERNKNHLAIIAWLSTVDGGSIKDHETACNTRSQSSVSGEWILKHEKVQDWRENDPPTSSILWLNGKPGAGKTILTSVIVEDCTKDPAWKTVYFYCKENDPSKNNSMNIFKELIGQFLRQKQELVPYCYDKRMTSGDVTLNSMSLVDVMLKVFIDAIPQVFIIIDGLDECQPVERKIVLTKLSELVHHCDRGVPGKLRVLFVSQYSKDIQKCIPGDASVLPLSSGDSRADIKEYVRIYSEKLQEKQGLDLDELEKLREKIWLRSDGMFLYARLVIENLLAHERRRDFRREIEEYFPRGLEQAYERIMERIETTHPVVWELVRKVLGWMICVRRPLKWQEIQAAISIDPESSIIDFEDLSLKSHIQDICGSLVIILPDDRGVELVHTTAKLHIARSGYIYPPAVERELTALCLHYLVFEYFSKDLDDETMLDHANSGQFAFQDYALANWFHHFRRVLADGHDTPLRSGDPCILTALEQSAADLEDALTVFVAEYGLADEELLSSATSTCADFEGSKFYKQMMCAWSHLARHDQKGPDVRNHSSIPALGDALIRNRKIIEDLSTPDDGNLTKYYGEKRFKCPKVTCFYFHEGFKDVSIRDQHINRHDRPFVCSAGEESCNVQVFGFTSNKDLERHMKMYHPDLHDLEHSFPKALKPTQAPKKLTCDHCSKTFTRGFHKRNHMRVHFGEKPFACEECGKTFTRANDCKRHEKIHAKRR